MTLPRVVGPALVAIAALALVSDASAQAWRRPLVRPMAPSADHPRPGPLSPAQMKQALAVAAPGVLPEMLGAPVRLSPDAPAKGGAYLDIYNAMVWTQPGSARAQLDEQGGSLTVHFIPQPGRPYLLDCTVEPDDWHVDYTISGGGTGAQTGSAPVSSNHVMVAVPAIDTAAGRQVTLKMPNDFWLFYACDLRPIG